MKGLPRSLSNGKATIAPIRKHQIVLRDVPVNINWENGAADWGTLVAGGLPEGNILFLGSVGYVEVRAASLSNTNVLDAFVGTVSMGTAATADGTLTDSGENDLLPATALGAATAKVSPNKRIVSTDAMGGGVVDNTAGDLECNLNISLADGAIVAEPDGVGDDDFEGFLINAVIELAYIVMLDD